MKINVSNELKINSSIREAEGARVSVRLGSFNQIKGNLRGIERRLSTILGGKKNWVGVKVDISYNFGAKPGSYNGNPDATELTIERFSSGWFLTSVNRISANTNMTGDWRLLLSEALKKDAFNHFLNSQMTENN